MFAGDSCAAFNNQAVIKEMEQTTKQIQQRALEKEMADIQRKQDKEMADIQRQTEKELEEIRNFSSCGRQALMASSSCFIICARNKSCLYNSKSLTQDRITELEGISDLRGQRQKKQ